MHQLSLIIKFLGTPSDADLAYITKKNVLSYIKSLSVSEKGENILAEKLNKNESKGENQSTNLFPNANPLAVELLSKMLVFNPENRLNAYDCLNHPYFQDIHDISETLHSDQKFDWSSLKIGKYKDDLREALYEEVLKIKNSFHI